MAILRRALLHSFLPAASLPLFAKKPFWLEKPADQWSAEEVDELMTKSPWAHSVSAQFSGTLQTGMPGAGGGMGRGGGMSGGMPGGAMGGGGGMPGGMGGPGGGGMGGGMPGGGMGGPGGGGMPGAMPEVKALIRWESAEPLRLARRGDWPSQYDKMYVISVSGLPMGQGRGQGRREGGDANPEEMRQRMMSQLREFTELRRKGREAVAPETIDAREGKGGRLLLFAFPQGAEPISLDEKEVEFRTRMGPLELRSKFKLKDMLYQGRLAL